MEKKQTRKIERLFDIKMMYDAKQNVFMFYKDKDE